MTSAPETVFIPVRPDVRLHVRRWPSTGTSFLLVHGLSSNARVWDGVAEDLAARGYNVAEVDQRGHGRSDKPDDGYDFATVSDDLARLIESLGFERPVVAGQSWGGNVVVELAARRPDLVRVVVGVDGGLINLQSSFPDWATCAEALAPPRLEGLRLAELEARLRAGHPDWPAAGIEGTLHNFEHLPDGTVRPWLTFERHMLILRQLWEHRPPELYARLAVPTLIVGALGRDAAWDAAKRVAADAAFVAIPQARIEWFEPADHDLHAQLPGPLAALLAASLDDGFFP